MQRDRALIATLAAATPLACGTNEVTGDSGSGGPPAPLTWAAFLDPSPSPANGAIAVVPDEAGYVSFVR